MRLDATLAAGALLLVACTPQTGAASQAPGSAAPSSAGIEITVAHTSAGDALAGPNGMTLYIFTSDTDGSSTCNGGCAEAWPPLVADGSAVIAGDGVSGSFGTATRDDGSRQVTHNGRPLYYYASDQEAGDATGHDVGGVWFIAPVGAASATPEASSSEHESESEHEAETPEPSATPYRPGY
jgi:predicted lipoprotein with Yx(FWY)xxD motif